MTIYYYDGFGNLTDFINPDRATQLAPPICSGGEVANWNGTGWVCSVFTPPTIPTNTRPLSIDAYEFYRLITAAERIAIHNLALTDMAAYDFMYTLQLTVSKGGNVVYSDPDLIAAMAYLQATPSNSPIFTAARAAQLMGEA